MKTEAELLGRRAELLAQLFLEDLSPRFVAKAPSDFGFDFVVGFNNTRGGINIVAVEVKAGEHIRTRLQMNRKAYHLLANSNVPGMVLAIDVKSNSVLYQLAHPEQLSASQSTISLSFIEADDKQRTYLRRLFSSDEGAPELHGR